MKSMIEECQALTKGLKALAKKTEQMAKKVDKLETAKTGQKRTTKARVKTTTKAKRRTGLKKKAAGKAPARKTVARKTKAPTGRRAILRKTKTAIRKTKTSTTTATAKVLGIVKRYKKGVGVPALMKKTRYSDSKIRDILSRAFAQRKVRRVGRGLYVAA